MDVLVNHVTEHTGWPIGPKPFITAAVRQSLGKDEEGKPIYQCKFCEYQEQDYNLFFSHYKDKEFLLREDQDPNTHKIEVVLKLCSEKDYR